MDFFSGMCGKGNRSLYRMQFFFKKTASSGVCICGAEIVVIFSKLPDKLHDYMVLWDCSDEQNQRLLGDGTFDPAADDVVWIRTGDAAGYGECIFSGHGTDCKCCTDDLDVADADCLCGIDSSATVYGYHGYQSDLSIYSFFAADYRKRSDAADGTYFENGGVCNHKYLHGIPVYKKKYFRNTGHDINGKCSRNHRSVKVF